jgi:signal transduction histidine kinase
MNRQKTLLIIDDEEKLRRNIRRYFEDSDFEVFEAADGKEGLDVFRQQNPDVVLIDLRMPGIDGLEVTRILEEESPLTPKIIVSGTGIIDDAIEAIRAGAWDYVIKPLQSMRALSHLVDKAMNRARLITEDHRYKEFLEQKIRQRTAELTAANISLQQEITERKKVEQGLKESEKVLRALSIRLQEVEEAHRKSIARELHDRVGQSLTALNINLNILHNQLRPEHREKINDRIMDSIELVEKTTQNIRDVMAELRPQVLDDYGLAPALRWLCERFFQRSGIDVDLETAAIEESRLPEMVETALFRITQEAFNNVIKHAQAASVSVAAVKAAESIYVTITDDGRGFDASAGRSSQHLQNWGLVNMRERAEALGGQFQIESEPGKGTRLKVEIPV